MIKLRPAESNICQSKIESLSTRRQSRVNIEIPESNIIDSLCNSLKTGNMYEREPKESVIIKSILSKSNLSLSYKDLSIHCFIISIS